jgi:cytochrome c oxidase subunit 4
LVADVAFIGGLRHGFRTASITRYSFDTFSSGNTMAHDSTGSHDGHDFAHPFPVWGLLAVFFALVFLTILTVAQANFELGSMEIVFSMIIATIKASLVVFFFMHLAFDKSYNAIIFLGSLLFVSLFLGFTIMDSQTTKQNFIVKTGAESNMP